MQPRIFNRNCIAVLRDGERKPKLTCIVVAHAVIRERAALQCFQELYGLVKKELLYGLVEEELLVMLTLLLPVGVTVGCSWT
jgi:hypothetical protein